MKLLKQMTTNSKSIKSDPAEHWSQEDILHSGDGIYDKSIPRKCKKRLKDKIPIWHSERELNWKIYLSSDPTHVTNGNKNQVG